MPDLPTRVVVVAAVALIRDVLGAARDLLPLDMPVKLGRHLVRR